MIKSLCYLTYPTARAYEIRRYRRRIGRKTPVLVYQMGKVGSCSVVESLRLASPRLAPLHLHYLTAGRLARIERSTMRVFRKRQRIARHYLDSLYVLRALRQGELERPVRIVTLLRDPVARSLSAFFHFLEFTNPDYPFEERLASEDPQVLARELEPLFWKRFEKDRYRPRNWFETELNRVFEVDVLSLPYPRLEGYGVCRTEGVDLLVLKLERLNECAPAAMREFLGLEQFAMHRSNEAREKSYYAVYRAFQETIRFPETVLDEVYGCPYVRHFYSDAELDSFRRRWQVTSDTRQPVTVEG